MGNFTTFSIAETGLSVQKLILDSVAANIANLNTTKTASGSPYQPKVVTLTEKTGFSSVMNNIQYSLSGVEVAEVRESNAEPKAVFDPAHPDANESGYVYYPNIDPVSQMVALLNSKRAYEANVKVINAAKNMALRALDIGS